MSQKDLDLLQPSALYEHYVHQLSQAINAYSVPQIVIGEALQNAIDAIVEMGGGEHHIKLIINFDTRTVTVEDTGKGFPNDPSLLFLGGSRKRHGDKRLFGLIGVGIKVVLFSSQNFTIRSSSEEGTIYWNLKDANKYSEKPKPSLPLPARFDPDDRTLSHQGTKIRYTFPRGTDGSPDLLTQFANEIFESCIQGDSQGKFRETLQYAAKRGEFSSRFCAMLAAFLQRFTYVGDVSNFLGNKPELKDTAITVTIKCQAPEKLGDEVGDLFDYEDTAKFDITPKYLHVDEVIRWVPNQARPGLFEDQLGRGGRNLSPTHKGFNRLVFAEKEEYKRLISDRRGRMPNDIDEYEKHLFPRINGIVLTIGRILDFYEFLPGGSRRIISANGVVTTHSIDLTMGRNQQYVRCFDMVVDLDARLNYGKTQITDGHLVNRVRRYINDAYSRTIQNAAAGWVGAISDDDDEYEYDVFLNRPDLGLREYTLKKEPTDENDVIALFFELAGHGVLLGYQIFGLSQKERYDSRAVIRYDGKTNDPPIPQEDRHLRVVEFKVKASNVIADLLRGAKKAEDMHLLIAWEEGASSSDQFMFADIEHSRFHPNRKYPKAQKYLRDTKTGAQVQVLLLKDVVNELKQQRD